MVTCDENTGAYEYNSEYKKEFKGHVNTEHTPGWNRSSVELRRHFCHLLPLTES